MVVQLTAAFIVRGLHAGLMAGALLLSGGGTLMEAPAVYVPAPLQAALFAKILAYDRNLPVAVSGRIEILVLYQRDFTESRDVASGFVSAFGPAGIRTVGGAAVSVTAMPFKDRADVALLLRNYTGRIVYIAPLRAFDHEALIRMVTASNAISITGVRAHVERGATLGVELHAGKPRILVNLDAARALGMDLSASLLKLSEVVP